MTAIYRVADFIADFIADLRVEHVFMLAGGCDAPKRWVGLQ